MFSFFDLEDEPFMGSQLGLQSRQRLELMLGTAQARAIGLEPGLRYTAGLAAVEEEVGSSSTKAE